MNEPKVAGTETESGWLLILVLADWNSRENL